MVAIDDLLGDVGHFAVGLDMGEGATAVGAAEDGSALDEDVMDGVNG